MALKERGFEIADGLTTSAVASIYS